LFVYRTGFEYLRYRYAAAATLSMLGVTALIVVVQHRMLRSRRNAFVV
jgi:multiple sugar transport system permease protein